MILQIYIWQENNVYFFATNIEANGSKEKNAGGVEAKDITLEILKDKKVYQLIIIIYNKISIKLEDTV